MSSKRNVNILADQHHPHSLPSYHPAYSTGPPVLSPVSAPAPHQHPSQALPGVSSLSNPPRYPPPPPQLHTSQSHTDAPDSKPDHGYNGPHSGHATPVIRNTQDAPYQRTPSTPVPQQQQQQQQGPPPPQLPPHERLPMENGHVSQPLYAAAPPPPPPPHPEQHYMMHPPPQHHPGPPPMMDHGPYAPHPTAYHSQAYLYPNMHIANQNTRKKSMRASQACDKCRERKSKCDEQRPCSTCKEQNIECHYKDSQPSKVDKSNAQVTEILQTVAEQLKSLTDRISGLEDRVGGPGHVKSERMSRQPSRNDTPTPSGLPDQETVRSLQEYRRPSLDETYDFAEHTTAAHKLLLRWPSINKLCNGKRGAHPRDYVLKEEDRGCLKLYGRGERAIEENVYIGAASPAHSTGSDELGVSSPDMANGFAYEDPKRSEPTLTTRLDMDSATLHRLFDRYKRHIHRLHPFLDIDQFGKYMRIFISAYSTDVSFSRYPASPHSMFIASNGSDSQKAGMKRKRSENPGAASLSSSDSGVKRRATSSPERTIINAIVYLVFALGKVCEAKRIPAPLPDRNLSPADQVQAHAGASPIIIKPSPASPHSNHYGYTPPAADSRGSSFGDSPGMEKKYPTNVDVIPGLDYYREAVSILGDFADANDLASAQARLLAALYKGQLARVQESWSWLHLASRTCQYRIRFEGLNNTYDPQMVFDKTKNLTLLAYWTCLQLESDILAELDYPHSGLSAMEGTVNWPNNVLDEEAARKIVSEAATDLDMINIYYSAQLFLRKHLNQIHTKLYGIDLAKQDPKTLSHTLDDLDNTLQGWRDLPHPITFWADTEAPHIDILAARLRAKYYGARYVTTRPFLDYALHVMEDVAHGAKLEDVTKDATGKPRRQELVLFKAIQMMPLDTIKRKVQICIDSAMKSTVALDGVQDPRLIVTNIMGTAHAQFGNLLVLAATYTSSVPWLSDLIPRDQLFIYLNRTIKFLENIEAASRTAKVDMDILQDLKVTLGFGDAHDEYSTSTSFSK